MKKSFLRITNLILLVFSPAAVFAEDNISQEVDKKLGIFSPLGLLEGDVPTLAGNFIKAGMGIIGTVALVIFIWAGFTWMTAGGDVKKVDNAKSTLIWAVIGIAVIFLSYGIVYFVIKAL
jgi:hypothetical protein